MARIACVYVPRFVRQSLLRADPELNGDKLIVHDDRVVLDAGAKLHGVRSGMTLITARALDPRAVYRCTKSGERGGGDALSSAAAALADLAAAFSPRYEVQAGQVLIDVADLCRLFDSEAHIASALTVASRRLRFETKIGIAGNRHTAEVAARSGREGELVSPGREAAFLAPLPIEMLSPSPEVMMLFRRWGVVQIGELANLPERGVAVRLGVEGARLAEIARGECDEPLLCRPQPLLFEESIELEWPVENAEALLFVLRRLTENVIERLICHSLACKRVTLTLGLSNRQKIDRQIELAAPTREMSTLLSLMRLKMESEPPDNAIAWVRLSITPSAARPMQLSFFAPTGPSPDKLATTLARLEAMVGKGRVGAPALVDSHLPDAFSVQPFAPSKKIAPISSIPAAVPRALALHAFRPARIAKVDRDRGRMRFLHADGISGQVIEVGGPYRVRESWWFLPVARDYYDIELSDGAVYRLYQDLHAKGWYIDGCYD